MDEEENAIPIKCETVMDEISAEVIVDSVRYGLLITNKSLLRFNSSRVKSFRYRRLRRRFPVTLMCFYCRTGGKKRLYVKETVTASLVHSRLK